MLQRQVAQPPKSTILTRGIQMLPVPIILSCLNKSPAAQQNIPADTTVASLFDSAYVHPILQKSSLLWGMYDLWAKNIFWLISGTSDGLDQWIGGVSKERFHLSSIFLCKSGKAMPYISTPTGGIGVNVAIATGHSFRSTLGLYNVLRRYLSQPFRAWK